MLRHSPMIIKIFALLAIPAMISGCVCCCGVDSMFNRYNAPLTVTTLPTSYENQGVQYVRVSTMNATIDQIKNEISKMSDQNAAGIIETVLQAMDVSGLESMMMSDYKPAGNNSSAAGFSVFILKFKGPAGSMTSYEAIKQAAPNLGGMLGEVKYEGSIPLGDECGKYTMNNGTTKVLGCRSSNVIIGVTTPETYDVAEAGLRMALAGLA